MSTTPKIEFIQTGINVPIENVFYKETTSQRWNRIVTTLVNQWDRRELIYGELRKLTNAGKRAVVVSDRNSLIEWLARRLMEHPLVHFARIQGETIPPIRESLLEGFKKKRYQVLLCSCVADSLPLHELEFDYLVLSTPTSHSRFKKRYKHVLRQKKPAIIRDYVDSVPWIQGTIKKRLTTAFSKGWGVEVTTKPSGENCMTNRHKETPAHCGRIGGPVTIEKGVCPECGWREEKEAHPLVHVAGRIPEKYIVVAGAGQSSFGPGEDPWETTAYDLALLEGGIENCNIVKYTSVIPPEAQQITLAEAQQQGLFHHGMVLECIMAQVNGNRHDAICAGVGTFNVYEGVRGGTERSKLVGGFAVEFEGKGSSKHAREMLAASMQGLFDRRYKGKHNYYMADRQFYVKELIVDESYGTALVGVCFVSFQIPMLKG